VVFSQSNGEIGVGNMPMTFIEEVKEESQPSSQGKAKFPGEKKKKTLNQFKKQK
jgi:hypothetical protein